MRRVGSQIVRKLLAFILFGASFTINPSANAALYSFASHTFTNCTATGNTGPTQAQCRTAYTPAGSWDETDSNFTVSGGIQTWTVPRSGTYSIQANGAAAGARSTTSVGLGASIQGEFSLTQGETLSILVGQRGTGINATSWGQGGGGGTFVLNGTSNQLLVAAGGGGSVGNGGGHAGTVSYTRTYGDASLTTTAKAGDTYSEAGGAGGVNGNAGGTSPSSYNGYPGAGFLQDAPAGGAKKFLNGMLGGTDATYGNGGFGGGGAAGYYGGSGGGGYSGGGANSRHGPGGGGGSYNSGVNKVETLTASAAEGSVLITFLVAALVDSTISLNVPSSFSYRTSSTLIATVSTPGKVTFFANGKRIGGCVSLSTVSSSTITASCEYKPAIRGGISISASLVPADQSSYRSSSVSLSRNPVAKRSNTR